MAALPYMQLYVAEYLADTTHLNAEQHGAYLLLLMNYWQRGKPLPDLNDRLSIVARSLPDRWNDLRTVLAEFFEIRDGMWIHHRMERDLEKVKGVSDAGKKAGIASGKARREKTSNGRSTVVQKSLNETRTKREPTEQNRTDTEHKKPSREKHEVDARHSIFKEILVKAWRVKNGDKEMPWSAGEGKQLSLLLSSVPSLDAETFRHLLHNRHRSDVNQAERPLKWLHSLTDYGNGPIDRYGKPLNASHTPAPLQAPLNALEAVRERNRKAMEEVESERKHAS